jgi:hypothetical protein
MKIRKLLYLIFGITLILINCWLTYDMLQTYDFVMTDNWLSIPQILGNQAFTIVGLFLLLGAYRVQRKINRKKKQELENAFTESQQ